MEDRTLIVMMGVGILMIAAGVYLWHLAGWF